MMFLTFVAFVAAVAAFNNPPGVDIWCGKAYRPTNASFEPGGWLEAPTPSSFPLLDLAIRPRMNLYLDNENDASFIVDANISYINGQPYYNTTSDPDSNTTSFTTLFIDIAVAETGAALVSGGNVSVNSTSNEIQFSLANFTASTTPYTITIQGSSADGKQVYQASTQLYKLPARNDGGSVVRIDSLYGGLQTQLSGSTTWTPLLPYSFYTSWDSYLNKSLSNVDAYAALGYNIIHIVPDTSLFDFTQFNQFLDRMDSLGLWVMYDMRWSYQNLSSVTYQLNQIKNRKSLLLYYTGDEPDGSGDPLNATKLAYDTIKSLDPYHPVSLCLNCYNFYFEQYSSGADILLEDVYPISNNVTFSNTYGTVCNTTYGCCGCDDCKGNFEDISERLDLFAQYHTWLNEAPKPTWGVPQAFGDAQFWTRYPTADEEAVMTLLSLNHGAKGIVMWDFPTTDELKSVTSALSKVLTTQEVAGFVLGAKTMGLPVQGGRRVDAAGWVVGGKMLVSVAYLEYEDEEGEVGIELPVEASGVGDNLWGDGGWSVSASMLTKTGLSALEVDVFVVDLA